jgi:predicted aspartyl protease
MRTRVGTFRYPVELLAASGEVFRALEPLVDTGALHSQFPDELLREAGYRPDATRTFRLADGTTKVLEVGEVRLRLNGETRTALCVFGPPDSEHLLGATTLEIFSLAPDPVNETLVPVVAMLA